MMDRVFVESTLENNNLLREEAIRMAEMILPYRKPTGFFVESVNININYVTVNLVHMSGYATVNLFRYPTKYFYMLDCEIIEEEELNQLKVSKNV